MKNTIFYLISERVIFETKLFINIEAAYRSFPVQLLNELPLGSENEQTQVSLDQKSSGSSPDGATNLMDDGKM